METKFTLPRSDIIKDAVCSFWQVHRDNVLMLNETIIPKGIIEIIFNLEPDPIHAIVNFEPVIVPRCFIQGYSTAPILLNLQGNQTFFGVVLNPTAVKYIFHFQPALIANYIIDLTLADANICTLWHQLAEQNDFEDRVNIFTSWISDRLPHLSDREHAFNIFLNSDIQTSVPITSLANQFCYSTRQLSRKIYELTGMNTEQTLLYKKYLQALHLIHNSKLSLTEIAYDCNFCDQSHFIKTFKTYSLLTPHEYRIKKSNIVGHIFENVH
ncbi:MAG TPA: AraC family transcriptional regulator [Saprospiraceae bacterium]|nr:helix-turn-helix transcriptional regulator [Saprospiraceae bacterium]HRO09068.1 AraC family transcriptional regulator [Saprospiraceae bacterium]HRP42415.1 AraC family transcriptional regulator [Saprospiraceae bacterium]